MKGILLLLVLAAPAMASDLPNAELCVLHDMTLITGASVAGHDEQALSAELRKRGEACSDPSYMQAATQRVQNLQTQAEALARLQQEHDALQAQLDQQQAEARAARIRAAGRAYLEMQSSRPVVQPPHPTITTCRDTTVGMQCTTN